MPVTTNLDVLWFCPLAGDGEHIGTREAPRRPTLEYMAAIIETAAELGFSSLLTATNYHAELETWTAATAALARTRGAGLLMAVRPGMFHPAILAKMAATAQTLFPGRVRLNVVTGSNPAENAMYGDFEDHEERYARTRELMTILRQLWTEDVVDVETPRYKTRGTRIAPKPPLPIPLYFGGASPTAQRIAAELADVYLLWCETMPMLRERLATMRALEAEVGRPLRYGLRCHVIVRETEDEAWAAADRLIARVDPDVRRAFQAASAFVDSEGQKRQLALQKGDLRIEENLWAGVGLARSGVGVAVVGDPDQVARKLTGYVELGIDTLILSGYPHFEECRRVGEWVLPRLRQRFGALAGDGPRFVHAPAPAATPGPHPLLVRKAIAPVT